LLEDLVTQLLPLDLKLLLQGLLLNPEFITVLFRNIQFALLFFVFASEGLHQFVRFHETGLQGVVLFL
jgi:hypothetical protein